MPDNRTFDFFLVAKDNSVRLMGTGTLEQGAALVNALDLVFESSSGQCSDYEGSSFQAVNGDSVFLYLDGWVWLYDLA